MMCSAACLFLLSAGTGSLNSDSGSFTPTTGSRARRGTAAVSAATSTNVRIFIRIPLAVLEFEVVHHRRNVRPQSILARLAQAFEQDDVAGAEGASHGQALSICRPGEIPDCPFVVGKVRELMR